jgi:hypothetical protein
MYEIKVRGGLMAGARARAVNNTSVPHQLRQLGDVGGDAARSALDFLLYGSSMPTGFAV